MAPSNALASQPVAGRAQGRIFFGWYIVAGGMLIEAFGYGSRYSFSVFFPTLLEQFGWPRDLGASILSSHLLFYGLAAPVCGWILDRIGSRRTMLAGAVMLSAGLIFSRWGSEPWHFYLTFGVLTGAGLCLLGSVPLTMIIRNWFERRRGMALALVYFGSGAAFACFPAVAWLIDTFGWRNAFALEGVIIAVLFIPLIWFVLVYSPAQKGLTKDGLIEQADNSTVMELEERRIVDKAWAATDWTLPLAVRTGRFWLLCLTTFCMWGVGHHIVVTHQVAFAIDLGCDRVYASSVLSLSGWTFCLGTLFAMLSDRLGREPVMLIGVGASATAILGLTAMTDSSQTWLLYFFSLVFGFGFGVCAPLVATTVTDIFQGPKIGATVGMIWFSFSLGGAVGPWLGGWLFETTGNYRAAFLIAAGLFVLAGAAIYAAAPRKVRVAPGRVKATARPS